MSFPVWSGFSSMPLVSSDILILINSYFACFFAVIVNNFLFCLLPCSYYYSSSLGYYYDPTSGMYCCGATGTWYLCLKIKLTPVAVKYTIYLVFNSSTPIIFFLFFFVILIIDLTTITTIVVSLVTTQITMGPSYLRGSYFNNII